MKNPLNKRLPRELKSEFGKYLVLFIFLAGMIALVSGFLVADGSMLKAYEQSFEKYNIEDGNFELDEEASDGTLQKIEQDGVTVYPNYYIEEETKDVDSTLRIFKPRTDVDKVCLMQGKMPEKADEIAIDRMYADNNELKVGDDLKVGKQSLKITGLVALSDYSALFSNTSDMMFDATKFGVAIMTEDGFATLDDTHIHYSYAWKYNDPPKNDTEAKTMGEDFLKKLAKRETIVNYIPEFVNQAIIFTGDDMGGDSAMFTAFLYIVVAIIAFVFAITTSNTISKEATVIGTLRASGYTKRELIRHYMTMPVIVMLAAAVVGNILGYTVLKGYMAAMYYGSYSLPTYVTIWSADAFIKTTLVPILILMLINYVTLRSKLSMSPLKFMRRDLSRRKKKKIVHLSSRIHFVTRFRFRIIFQNVPNYITIFVGVFFANLILLFGLMFSPLLAHFEQDITHSMLCKYQYVLQDMDSEEFSDAPDGTMTNVLYKFYTDALLATSTKGAEKYSITTLKTQEGKLKSEDVMVYGVSPDSAYEGIEFQNPDDIYISNAFAEKHNIHVGDSVTLDEPYDDNDYTFKIAGIYTYPASIAVFMEQDQYNKVFNKQEGYFNGYFSDKKITDISDEMISTVITKDDLDKTCRQLEVSMGNMMVLFQGFGVIMFVLIIYLLSKIIIEKNAQSISMAKILGYTNHEINGLYITTTTIVVVLSLILTIPLANITIEEICKAAFAQFSGWLPYYVPEITFVKMFAAGVIAYALVAFFQIRKVKRIPMTDALKNVE
ncbi:MAG: ABC transporter permease [Lachnospiraceae bacterium]|nr:ABC transporter permease [Lachnospiraceae bacterium]